MRKDFYVQNVNFYLGTALLASTALLSMSLILRTAYSESELIEKFSVTTEDEIMVTSRMSQ